MRKIFLACPYGHDDPRVVAQRFDISNRVAAAILRSGHAVFSQVSMSHPINAAMAGLDRAAVGKLWAPVDEVFMAAMEELVVVDIDGWEASAGIRREIAFFEARGRKVSLWSQVEAEFTAATGA
ncbi:MAG: DUF1937 family protein [Phreatobacter sp.]